MALIVADVVSSRGKRVYFSDPTESNYELCPPFCDIASALLLYLKISYSRWWIIRSDRHGEHSFFFILFPLIIIPSHFHLTDRHSQWTFSVLKTSLDTEQTICLIRLSIWTIPLSTNNPVLLSITSAVSTLSHLVHSVIPLDLFCYYNHTLIFQYFLFWLFLRLCKRQSHRN